jgi:hypothetical protein
MAGARQPVAWTSTVVDAVLASKHFVEQKGQQAGPEQMQKVPPLA